MGSDVHEWGRMYTDGVGCTRVGSDVHGWGRMYKNALRSVSDPDPADKLKADSSLALYINANPKSINRELFPQME